MSTISRSLLTIACAILLAAISGYAAASFAIGRAAAAAPTIISARQFDLVDETGHVGARLTWQGRQPALRMFDEKNRLRSALFLEPNGVPDFYLYDANGKVRAALNLFDSGVPNLAFLDESQKYMVWTEFDNQRSYNLTFSALGENKNKILASRRISADASGLHEHDTNGKSK